MLNKTYILAGVSWLLAGCLALSMAVNSWEKKPINLTTATCITAGGGVSLVLFSLYFGLKKADETCVFNCEVQRDH